MSVRSLLRLLVLALCLALTGSTVAGAAPAAEEPDAGMPIGPEQMAGDGIAAAAATQARTWNDQPAARGKLVGIDIAKWQHPYGAAIDWRQVAAGSGGARPSFVFIKGSDGISTTANAYLASDKQGALANGLVVGIYHYVQMTYPPAEEAAAAARAAGPLGPGMMPLVLDLEKAPAGWSKQQVANWAVTWLETAERLTGRTPIVYTYPYFFQTTVAPDPRLARYPLWMAHYGTSVSAPIVPTPWQRWSFWQFSEQGRLPGIASDVDLDVFSGTRQELDALAGRNVNTRPKGSLDVVRAEARTLRVQGWAVDPDTRDPITVSVRVDGVERFRGRAQVPRPDVGASQGLGDNHGFDLALPVVPGAHQVCVSAVDSANGSEVSLGCRGATVAKPRRVMMAR